MKKLLNVMLLTIALWALGPRSWAQGGASAGVEQMMKAIEKIRGQDAVPAADAAAPNTAPGAADGGAAQPQIEEIRQAYDAIEKRTRPIDAEFQDRVRRILSESRANVKPATGKAAVTSRPAIPAVALKAAISSVTVEATPAIPRKLSKKIQEAVPGSGAQTVGLAARPAARQPMTRPTESNGTLQGLPARLRALADDVERALA